MTVPARPISTLPARYAEADCRLSDFAALVDPHTELPDFPHAAAVEKNVLIYDADAVRHAALTEAGREEVMTELVRALTDGPGVVTRTCRRRADRRCTCRARMPTRRAIWPGGCPSSVSSSRGGTFSFPCARATPRCSIPLCSTERAATCPAMSSGWPTSSVQAALDEDRDADRVADALAAYDARHRTDEI